MAVTTARWHRRLRRIRPPHAQVRAAPFGLGRLDAGLDGPLQGGPEQGAAVRHGLRLAGGEGLAGRDGLGQVVELGDERDGPLDGDALRVRPILKGSRRHGPASVSEMTTAGN
jgi:hypothetical protein